IATTVVAASARIGQGRGGSVPSGLRCGRGVVNIEQSASVQALRNWTSLIGVPLKHPPPPPAPPMPPMPPMPVPVVVLDMVVMEVDDEDVGSPPVLVLPVTGDVGCGFVSSLEQAM